MLHPKSLAHERLRRWGTPEVDGGYPTLRGVPDARFERPVIFDSLEFTKELPSDLPGIHKVQKHAVAWTVSPGTVLNLHSVRCQMIATPPDVLPGGNLKTNVVHSHAIGTDYGDSRVLGVAPQPVEGLRNFV